MMDELKKNELNEQEMDSVTGGYDANGRTSLIIKYNGEKYNFLMNNTDRELFDSFSAAEQNQVLAQPDRSSKRAKMIEIWNEKQARPHGGGASGRW